MPSGFISYLPSGQVQIDADASPILSFRAKGTVAMAPAETGVNRVATYEFTGVVNPVLFVQVGHGFGIRSIVDPSKFIYIFRSPWAVATLNWWLFDVPELTGNVGVQLLRGDGAVIFNSNQMPLLPHVFQPTVNAGSPPTASLVSGRTFGVHQSAGIANWVDLGPAPIGRRYRQDLKYANRVGDTLQWDTLPETVPSTTDSIFPMQPGVCSAIVTDVTEL